MNTPILDAIVGRIARFLHPDQPRDWFPDVKFFTDYSEAQVTAALDAAAKENPQFKNWKTSWVDLLKLTHPDDPDGASSPASRKALAKEMGDDDYTGTAKENIAGHANTFKALRQRGIKLPD